MGAAQCMSPPTAYICSTCCENEEFTLEQYSLKEDRANATDEMRWVNASATIVRSSDPSLGSMTLLESEPAIPRFGIRDSASPVQRPPSSPTLGMVPAPAASPVIMRSQEKQETMSEVIPFNGSPLATSLPSLALPQVVVDFEFACQGLTHLVTLTKRPMGVAFESKAPFLVTSTTPGSEAEEQGVRPGWAFSRVAGVSVADMSCKDLVQLIHDKCMYLPKDPSTPRPFLALEFEVDGVPKVLTFTRGPIGLTFNEASARPFAVEKVFPQSEGARAGVEPGWELRRVGEIPAGSEWGSIMRVLSDRSSTLPRY